MAQFPALTADNGATSSRRWTGGDFSPRPCEAASAPTSRKHPRSGAGVAPPSPLASGRFANGTGIIQVPSTIRSCSGGRSGHGWPAYSSARSSRRLDARRRWGRTPAVEVGAARVDVTGAWQPGGRRRTPGRAHFLSHSDAYGGETGRPRRAYLSLSRLVGHGRTSALVPVVIENSILNSAYTERRVISASTTTALRTRSSRPDRQAPTPSRYQRLAAAGPAGVRHRVDEWPQPRTRPSTESVNLCHTGGVMAARV